jgi:hypothetical protein
MIKKPAMRVPSKMHPAANVARAPNLPRLPTPGAGAPAPQQPGSVPGGPSSLPGSTAPDEMSTMRGLMMPSTT